MSDAKNIFKVKIFLKAKSAEELIELQVRNNLANNMMYTYGDPIPVEGGYIVWFLADINKWKRVD